MFFPWIEEHILLTCLIFATAAGCGWLWIFRHRLQMPSSLIPVMSALNTAAGVVCVKLFAGLETWGNPLESGQSLFGSIFLLPIMYFIGARLFRRPFCDVFDVFVMCTITTLIFARIACIVSGCCQGQFLPGSESLRWPTRELEIIFHIGLLIFFYIKNRKGTQLGELWPLYMIAYGSFRFCEEWLRAGEVVFGPFHYGHIWAVLSVIIGSAVYLELREQRSKVEYKNVKKQFR